MRFQALIGLFSRYWQVFAAAWSTRRNLAPVDRENHERAFLPAALELQDTPPHPAARVALWSLITLLLISLLWSYCGKIDVVAVAPGKLIISDRSKVVQPLEPGVVKAIHVQDGQHVQAGQLLIELDSTITDADSDKNNAALQDAELETQRASALITALNGNRPPELKQGGKLLRSDDGYRQKMSDIRHLLTSQWQELQSRLSTIEADISRKQAERAGTHEQVKKLEQTVPMVAQRASDYKDLFSKNIVARHDYMEKEQSRIEIEQDLSIQRRKLEELSEGLSTSRRQRDATIAEFRRNQHDILVKSRERIKELSQEVVKAKQHYNQTRLVSPVAGIVQQLAVHTVGGVVTAAQPLMVIVPEEDAVEAEAMLENKDIGFVKVGQDAAIKIETFNYTKYGLLNGKVQNVSLDAIQDEKRGLVYSARITLSKHSMDIEGKTVKLAPGMAVTVEIKSAQRRIIEYFLSPLLQHLSESLRER